MYRKYRFMPEANRTCARQSYERSYGAHMDALRRIYATSGAILGIRATTGAKSGGSRTTSLPRGAGNTRRASENHAILLAVQDRTPVMTRDGWFRHKLDHEYQLQKIARFREIVPMRTVYQETGPGERGSGVAEEPGAPRAAGPGAQHGPQMIADSSSESL